VAHPVEFTDPVGPRRSQVLVLPIEKCSEIIEFALAAIGQAAIVRSRHATGDVGDDGRRIRGAPALRALLDRVEVRHQVGSAADALPNVLRRLLFSFLAGVVRIEELPVCGDDVAANRGLLVTKCRL
jgi:hypothetical protein